MTLNFFLVSVFSLFFITACGGGGGGDKNSGTGNLPFVFDGTKDLDTLDKNLSVGFNALSSSEVEYSVCFADLPDFRNLNDLYYEKSLAEPTEDIFFEYTIGENDMSSTSSELIFLSQNKSVYSLLESLLFNVKNTPVNGGRPVFGISTNKPIYYNIRGFCRDIQCTADSVFGDSWGLRFLFKERFGVLLSGYVDPKTEPYSDNDSLLSVAQAILSLPKGTFPLNKDHFLPNDHGHDVEKNIVIAPFLTGLAPPEGLESASAFARSGRQGSSANSLVTSSDVYFLEPWKSQRDHFSKMSTAFHELIHVLDASKEKGHALSKTNDWLKLSKWSHNPVSDEWTMGNEDVMCSGYGTTNPAEDFAECGSLYRFAPLRLKKISESKYDFFKKRVFNGVEYTDVNKCKNAVETF